MTTGSRTQLNPDRDDRYQDRDDRSLLSHAELSFIEFWKYLESVAPLEMTGLRLLPRADGSWSTYMPSGILVMTPGSEVMDVYISGSGKSPNEALKHLVESLSERIIILRTADYRSHVRVFAPKLIT